MWKARLPFSSPTVIRDISETWCNAYATYDRFVLHDDAAQWCAENDISLPVIKLGRDDATSKWYFDIWFDVELHAIAFRMRW